MDKLIIKEGIQCIYVDNTTIYLGYPKQVIIMDR
jgi:hypothetical protein